MTTPNIETYITLGQDFMREVEEISLMCKLCAKGVDDVEVGPVFKLLHDNLRKAIEKYDDHISRIEI